VAISTSDNGINCDIAFLIRNDALYELVSKLYDLQEIKMHWHDTISIDDLKDGIYERLLAIACDLPYAPVLELKEYYGPDLEEGERLSRFSLLGQRRMDFASLLQNPSLFK